MVVGGSRGGDCENSVDFGVGPLCRSFLGARRWTGTFENLVSHTKMRLSKIREGAAQGWIWATREVSGGGKMVREVIYGKERVKDKMRGEGDETRRRAEELAGASHKLCFLCLTNA